MALMTPNPFLAAELWSLLELLPYSRRFELYEDVSVSPPRCWTRTLSKAMAEFRRVTEHGTGHLIKDRMK